MSRKSQLLSIALPSESGLPSALDELDRIQRCAQNYPVQQLVELDATLENVVKGMQESSWVHFACHGVQDASNPTERALLLFGGSRLTLSRMIGLHLPHSELAFLSACQTAKGDEKLSEEAVHLAAGMLSAGYRGVIATMWSIGDNDGPPVAEDVYKHLFCDSPPDPKQAAYALHIAVQNLRRSGKSLLSWVPFIHIGI